MTADMSDACEKYIRMMIHGVPRVAFQYLSGLQDQELFRALAVPAREDITNLFDTEPEVLPALRQAFREWAARAYRRAVARPSQPHRWGGKY